MSTAAPALPVTDGQRVELTRMAKSTVLPHRMVVERWFKELTDKRLRRGVFTSVDDLITAITTWAEHWNEDPKPFIWKATAEDIITKVQRGREALHQINNESE